MEYCVLGTRKENELILFLFCTMIVLSDRKELNSGIECQYSIALRKANNKFAINK